MSELPCYRHSTGRGSFIVESGFEENETMQLILMLLLLVPALSIAQEAHKHPAPEKLGAVAFPTSCRPHTQQEFNRAVALLHSFAYSAAETAFRTVAEQDSECAIAHWGIAMTHFH